MPRPVAESPSQHRLLDGAEAYPDVVGPTAARRRARSFPTEPEPELDSIESVFETSSEHTEYRLPDRDLLRASPAAAAAKSDSSAKTADLLVRTLSEFGVEATVIGSDLRPARHALRAAAGARHEGVEGRRRSRTTSRYALATTEIRILAPIPGKQAVGVEVPNLSPKLVTLGDIYGDLPATASPLSVWLGKDISGNADLDRSRAHAAPPHRRHDRLGQVGLHQHDPHLDAPALDAGRGADDPHRPEADRARLLRVDPAPPDARRLEPEGGGGRAHERRRRDGAPLRAPLVRPRAQPARGEPRVPRARRGRRSRTCSSSSTSSPT